MSCPRLAGGGSGRRRRWPGPVLGDRRGPQRQRLHHPRPGRPTSPTGSSCARGRVRPSWAAARLGRAVPGQDQRLPRGAHRPAGRGPTIGGGASQSRGPDRPTRRRRRQRRAPAVPRRGVETPSGRGRPLYCEGWPGSHCRSRRLGGADNITAAPRHCEGNAGPTTRHPQDRPVDDFCPGPARFCTETDADPADRYRERNLIGRRQSERFGEPPAIIRRAPGRRTPCPADVAGGRLRPSTPQEG
jgi:hypothetical protein